MIILANMKYEINNSCYIRTYLDHIYHSSYIMSSIVRLTIVAMEDTYVYLYINLKQHEYILE